MRVGPMTPKFKLRRDICTVHLAAKFHHPVFNRSEVIVLTNKQMPLKTSTSHYYATLVGNNHKTMKLYTKTESTTTWHICTFQRVCVSLHTSSHNVAAALVSQFEHTLHAIVEQADRCCP